MNLRGAKPIVDFSIRESIEYMMPTPALYNHAIADQFKKKFFRWIQSSRLNRLRNMDQYHSVQLVSGTIQSFDHFYWRHRDRRFRFMPGEFMYHQACLKQGACFKLLENDLMRGDALLLSVPFSDIGEQHPSTEKLLHQCDSLGVPVLLDFAYYPCTKNIDLDLGFECIDTITFSISKAFYGAEFLRVGIRCQRENRDDGIDVFNSVDMINRISVHVADRLISEYSVDHNWKKYNKAYQQVCKEKNLKPTNCIMFGLGGKEYEDYNRGGTVNRVCVSELIGEKINDRSK